MERKNVIIAVGAAGAAALALILYTRRAAAVPPSGPPSGKTSTQMVVTTAPPSSMAPYTLFTFAGYLVDAQGTRLSGKTVTLYDGGSAVGNVTTASDGTWGWSLSRAPGTYTFYAEFAGDSTYAGC